MDSFCEQIVYKKNTPKESFFQFFLIFLTFVVGLTAFFIFSTFITIVGGFVVGGLIIGFGLWGLTFTYYEHEYAFTNGDLDIDKIIARRKRRRLITVEVKSVSDFGKASDLKGVYKKINTTLIQASDGILENMYYLDFKSQKYGNTRLIISPDEKMLDNMNKYLPRHLKNKFSK